MSASDRAMWRGHLLLGAAGDDRVARWQKALEDAGLPAARLIDYRQVVDGRVPMVQVLADAAGQGDRALIRIESPGREFEVYKALLQHGHDETARRGLPTVNPELLASLPHQRGLILCPAQWFHGFSRVLDEVSQGLHRHRALRATSQPDDIATMFDKQRCHRLLHDAGIAVARPVSDGRTIGNYDDLRDAMAASRMQRVFIKLRYGSSAVGVVAYQAGDRRELAITTTELVRNGDDIALYSSRRLRRYEAADDVRSLVDGLCSHGVHVEGWFPKASVDGFNCDLRVVMIAGVPRHIVLRSSRSPLTNLHLLNQRSDAGGLRRRMTDGAWQAMMEDCRRVAALFPRTLHMGIDVAAGIDLRSHAVLEVNAFGDLLKDVTDEGMSTHEAQVRALMEELP